MTVEDKVLRGKIGLTKVALLTITDEEFAAAKRIFELNFNFPSSPYFAKTELASGPYDTVVRQASDRTNVPAMRATNQFIEDFRPAFVFLVGTAGGVLKKKKGRDGSVLGDVIAADFIDYTEFVKLGNDRLRWHQSDATNVLLSEALLQRSQ